MRGKDDLEGTTMAGEWIKMRASLVSDPKVMVIARSISAVPFFSRWLTYDATDDVTICDVALRHCVTGALHSVWCACNEHVTGDILIGAELEWIDGVTGIAGFGAAMEKVGWVKQSERGLIFPKFDSNNTSSAERQRKYREKMKRSSVTSDAQRYVTRDVTGNAREEKRREEKKNTNTESCSETPKASSPPPSAPAAVALEFPVDGKGAKTWTLTEAKVSEYQESFPNVNVLSECRAALQWVRDNPTKRKTASGMASFLTRWLTKATNLGGSPRAGPPGPSAPRKSTEEIMAEIPPDYFAHQRTTDEPSRI